MIRQPPRPPLPPNLLAIRSGRRHRWDGTVSWVAIRCEAGHAPPSWAAIDLAAGVLGERPAWCVGCGDRAEAGALRVARRTRRGVVVVRREQ